MAVAKTDSQLLDDLFKQLSEKSRLDRAADLQETAACIIAAADNALSGEDLATTMYGVAESLRERARWLQREAAREGL